MPREAKSCSSLTSEFKAMSNGGCDNFIQDENFIMKQIKHLVVYFEIAMATNFSNYIKMIVHDPLTTCQASAHF